MRTLRAADGREITNALEEAIYLELGGPVPACHALLVSTQAVYKLVHQGFVSSRALALKIQNLTGVPAAELMQLAPWRGPERLGDDPEPGKRRRDPKAPTPLRPVGAAATRPGDGVQARTTARGKAAARRRSTPTRCGSRSPRQHAQFAA
jgi:hypothetical protein